MRSERIKIIGRKRLMCIKEMHSLTLYLINQIHIHGGFTSPNTVDDRIMLDHMMAIKFKLKKDDQFGLPSYFFEHDLPNNIKALLVSLRYEKSDKESTSPI